LNLLLIENKYRDNLIGAFHGSNERWVITDT
jgi:hypothetical protein